MVSCECESYPSRWMRIVFVDMAYGRAPRADQSKPIEAKINLNRWPIWHGTIRCVLRSYIIRHGCGVNDTFSTNASSINGFFFYLATVTNELTEPWLCGLAKIKSAFCNLLGTIVVITTWRVHTKPDRVDIVKSEVCSCHHRDRRRPLVAYLILT